jgi:hypothetical protein
MARRCGVNALRYQCVDMSRYDYFSTSTSNSSPDVIGRTLKPGSMKKGLVCFNDAISARDRPSRWA